MLFLDLVALDLPGFVLPALVRAGRSNLQLNAAFGMATTLGMALGGWLAAWVGGRLGWRVALRFTAWLAAVAALISACAPGILVLIGLRLFAGAGIGGGLVVGCALVMAYSGAAGRTGPGVMVALFAFCAFAACVLLAYAVLASFGWRALFVIVGLATLVCCIAVRGLPEVPCKPVRCDSRSARQVSVAIALSLGLGAGFAGYLQWLPATLTRHGWWQAGPGAQIVVFSLAPPAGGFLAWLAADRVSAKVATGTAALVLAAAALLLPVLGDRAAGSVMPVLVTGLYGLAASGWITHVPALFPPAWRLHGMALSLTCLLLAAAAMRLTLPVIFAEFGLFCALLVPSVVLVLQAAMVVRWTDPEWHEANATQP